MLAPLDNQRLASLCGALDENLRQIEAGLDVSIARRGERFVVQGDARQVARALQLIEHFYVTSKGTLTIDDVQLGLVEFQNQTEGTVARTEVATDEPAVARKALRVTDDPQLPALITRRPDLHGRTPRQREYLRSILEHDITFGIGPAGTGKTYLAVACAVDALERDAVKRVVLVRPAVEAGERLGFLPGDLVQKVDPYLRPLYDALYDLMGYDKVGKMFERNAIEIAPLAFMRGRTLNHAFIILDEAQNTTPEQMKMFLTRTGFGSKVVITGDVTQIDLARGQKSGLVEAQRILDGVRGIAFTQFQAEDVVRHPLVQRIITAYEAYEHAAKSDDSPDRG